MSNWSNRLGELRHEGSRAQKRPVAWVLRRRSASVIGWTVTAPAPVAVHPGVLNVGATPNVMSHIVQVSCPVSIIITTGSQGHDR